MTDLLTTLGARRHGRKWQCPAHGLTGDHTVSLSITTGDHGALLLYCHAGCGYKEILRALALNHAVLTVAPPGTPARHARAHLRNVKFPPPKHTGTPAQRGYRFDAEHRYGDDVWLVRLRHPTTGAKEITWESLNGRGERVPGLLGRRTRDLPLYYERDARMAIAAGEPVLLVESESSVDALVKAGHYAITWAGGAGSPNIARIRDVFTVQSDHGPHTYPALVVIPDHDDAGLACLAAFAAARLAPHVVVPEPGEDARDLFARLGAEAFRAQLTYLTTTTKEINR